MTLNNPHTLYKSLALLIGLAFTLVFFSYGSALQASEKLSNKWRIEFSEGAKSDGNIVFRLTPKDGEPLEVTAAIEDGTGENSVAKHVRDAFRAQLPEGAYHVERDDGEDVLVKRRGDTPRFSLQLISNSVKAVRIDIERE